MLDKAVRDLIEAGWRRVDIITRVQEAVFAFDTGQSYGDQPPIALYSEE